jgi:hypothetical protein
MNLRFGITLVCLAALSSFALAQSPVDGTWAGEVQGGRGGQQLVTITLKADGDKLTGSFSGAGQGPIDIQEGMVSGSTVSFKNTLRARAVKSR